ncbi:hypothetical protein [Leptospira alexanderi]|uniref:Uncharacterized protein n=1 Tax=Leptospira alexanderi serovar Manhao 3 str. L 60 TaxID=1049759 RepID=V6HYH6_9LEPT|nr:hypothetical protein [Leptospira alexanderi]EQA62566.1 hypothetical protein LEP1GSC062_3333 [Leptospira alexanderi serovar Manhao 3 str. L 60]
MSNPYFEDAENYDFRIKSLFRVIKIESYGRFQSIVNNPNNQYRQKNDIQFSANEFENSVVVIEKENPHTPEKSV